jgi:cell wall-associated NlpC family hydrolase
VNARPRHAFQNTFRAACLALATLFTISGCSIMRDHPSSPPVEEAGEPAATHPGDVVSQVALSMIGVPYRYGGATPAGFDCSGLVWFAHLQAGVPVPRTAAEQERASRTLSGEPLHPGDLLFFDTSWRSGHVGIYVGGGDFVHAPSSGKRVMRGTIREGYFSGRLRRASRFIER